MVDLAAVRAKVAELRELSKRATVEWCSGTGALGGYLYASGHGAPIAEFRTEHRREADVHFAIAARNSWDAALDCIEALVERQERSCHSGLCHSNITSGDYPCDCGYDRADAALAAWLEAM